MALRVDAVEVDPLDGLRARGLQLRDGVVPPGMIGQVGQHDADMGVAQVALTDRQPDLGCAAEQQDGLRNTGVIKNHYSSSKRRAMSDAKTPCGSALRRNAIHSSMRGY